MKDANGREIQIGDRVRYARHSGVTMWPAPPVNVDMVERFASSECVHLKRGMKGYSWIKKTKGGEKVMHEPVFTFLACGLEVVDEA